MRRATCEVRRREVFLTRHSRMANIYRSTYQKNAKLGNYDQISDGRALNGKYGLVISSDSNRTRVPEGLRRRPKHL